jgi:hypothetical protein
VAYVDWLLNSILAFHRRIQGLPTQTAVEYSQFDPSQPDQYKLKNGDDADWVSVDLNDDELELTTVEDTDEENDQPVDILDEHSQSSSKNVDLSSNNEDEAISSSSAHVHTLSEIAVLLALFRHRHSISKPCLTDICRLLRLFNVPNVPLDYRSIYNLTNRRKKSFFSQHSLSSVQSAVV